MNMNMEHRTVKWSKRQRECVVRLLLCVWRLERRGDVVTMDPAVLEEMLEQLREVCTWYTKRVVVFPFLLIGL